MSNFTVQKSTDGTQKLLYKEGYIAVVIPSIDDKHAVCVSCQIGCPIGCHFCHTGKLKRNLSSQEIFDQVIDATSTIGKRITSVVFMGMGEPMANFKEVSTAIEMLNKKYGLAYKRITLSTSCVNLDKLLDVKYHVAISLHTPFDDVRKKIIPGAMPIVKIMQFVKKYCDSRKFGVMIEYALMSGVNDRDEDIEALLKLDWPKNVFFNMIQYNDLGEFKRSDKLEYFKDKIRAAGYKCFIRLSRGADIEAACGMLDVE